MTEKIVGGVPMMFVASHNPSFKGGPRPYHIRVADRFKKQSAEQFGTTATAEKRNRQEALIVLLRKLKHYVVDNCGNDMDVLLS